MQLEKAKMEQIDELAYPDDERRSFTGSDRKPPVGWRSNRFYNKRK